MLHSGVGDAAEAVGRVFQPAQAGSVAAQAPSAGGFNPSASHAHRQQQRQGMARAPVLPVD